MAVDEILALVQGTEGADQLAFSIINTQQPLEQSSRKRKADHSDKPKKQQKRHRTIRFHIMAVG